MGCNEKVITVHDASITDGGPYKLHLNEDGAWDIPVPWIPVLLSNTGA